MFIATVRLEALLMLTWCLREERVGNYLASEAIVDNTYGGGASVSLLTT